MEKKVCAIIKKLRNDGEFPSNLIWETHLRKLTGDVLNVSPAIVTKASFTTLLLLHPFGSQAHESVAARGGIRVGLHVPGLGAGVVHAEGRRTRIG